MFAFGYYLARYIDWCDARVKRLKRWHVFAIQLSAVIVMSVSMEYAPGWLATVVFVTVVPLCGVFSFVASRHFKRLSEKKRDTLAQFNKTQSRLRGFRK